MDKEKSRTAAAMTSGAKKRKKKAKKGSGKRPHKMTIRRAANGGFVVQHDFKPQSAQEMPEPEEHAIPDLESLKDHVGLHMQEPEEGQGGGQPPAEEL